MESKEFTLEGLNRGDAPVIGNFIRRMLMSSYARPKVVGVRFPHAEEVTTIFDAIDGVATSTLDIVMTLTELNLEDIEPMDVGEVRMVRFNMKDSKAMTEDLKHSFALQGLTLTDDNIDLVTAVEGTQLSIEMLVSNNVGGLTDIDNRYLIEDAGYDGSEWIVMGTMHKAYESVSFSYEDRPGGKQDLIMSIKDFTQRDFNRVSDMIDKVHGFVKRVSENE